MGDEVSWGTHGAVNATSSERPSSILGSPTKIMNKNEKIAKSLKEYFNANPKQRKTYICEKCEVEFEGHIRKGRRVRCDNCKRKVAYINSDNSKSVN